MSYKQAKFDIETMFQNSWITTPIHWAGQEFNAEGIPRWVNPFYSPTSSMSNGARKGLLNVVCWAENDVEAFGLADEMTDFTIANLPVDYRITRSEVADHGWEESNSVFILLLFQIEYIDKQC